MEKVDWFPECTTEIPDSDELRDWMTLGPVSAKNSDPPKDMQYKISSLLNIYLIPDFDSVQRKLKIEDETEFCTEDLLHTLLRCKVSYIMSNETGRVAGS